MLADLLIGLGCGVLLGGAGVYYWQSRVRAKLSDELDKLSKMAKPQDGGPGVPKDPH